MYRLQLVSQKSLKYFLLTTWKLSTQPLGVYVHALHWVQNHTPSGSSVSPTQMKWNHSLGQSGPSQATMSPDAVSAQTKDTIITIIVSIAGVRVMRYSSEFELSAKQLWKKVVGEEAGKFRKVGRHYLWVSLYTLNMYALGSPTKKSQYCLLHIESCVWTCM